MAKKKLISILTSLVTVSLVSCAATSYAAHEHDNKFSLSPLDADKISNLTIGIDSYSITYGQPYSGLTSSGYTFVLKAGRKKSTSVGNAFNNYVSPSQILTNHKPSKLNFSIFGTVTITDSYGVDYVIPNIAIAQGSTTPGVNNWWFGGKACKYIPSDYPGVVYDALLCQTSKPAYSVAFFHHKNGTTTNFRLKERISCPQSADKAYEKLDKITGQHYCAIDLPRDLRLIDYGHIVSDPKDCNKFVNAVFESAVVDGKFNNSTCRYTVNGAEYDFNLHGQDRAPLSANTFNHNWQQDSTSKISTCKEKKATDCAFKELVTPISYSK